MEMNATTDSPPSSSTVATCVEALARAGLMLVAILVILILLVALLFIIYFVTSNRRPKIFEKIPGIEKLFALKEKHKRRKHQQSNGLKSAKIKKETTITDAYSTSKSTSNSAVIFTTNNKCTGRDCELADTKTAKHHGVEESSMYEIPLYDSETPTIEKPVFVSSGKRLEADNSTHSNRVETIVVDETTIESEHTDESFPEPPPVPAQEVELAKTDNEENGNVSKEPTVNKDDDVMCGGVSGGSDLTLEKPKLSKMLAEVQNYNSNVSASPRRDDSRLLNGNIGSDEADRGFCAPETPNKYDTNSHEDHKDTVKLSPEQCSKLAVNQQRLEAERQQLRQLGII